MVLSNKQKEDLDKAVLCYLTASRHDAAYASLLSSLQSSNSSFAAPDQSSQFGDMLEKKWSSLIRLNKRIMELEAANAQLKEDAVQAAASLASGGRAKTDESLSLPREPCKATLISHRDAVRSVKFHPRFSLLATASEDATIKLWDSDSGRLERTLQGHQDAVQDIDFNPSGSLLSSASADLSIKLWSFESMASGAGSVDDVICTKTLQGHDHSVSCCVFVPNGDFIISGSRDKNIKMWEVATGYCTRTFRGHDQWVRGVSIHPNGLVFASGSMDKTIRTWNIATGETIKEYMDHEHVVECVAYSNAKADVIINAARKEEETIAATAKNGGVPLPVVAAPKASANGAASASSSSSSSSSAPAAAPVPAGGLFLATGSRDRSIRIYEIATGATIATLTHDNWVNSLLFHPSGRYLLSCSDDKSIRVWDCMKGFKPVRKIANAHDAFISCFAWNPTQAMMASGAVDNNVKLWDCR